MKQYTIIGGVNGAGKSSLTGVLKAERSDLGHIIDVDKLAIAHGGFIEGGKQAVEMQRQFIASGISFTQETTLSGQRPLLTFPTRFANLTIETGRETGSAAFAVPISKTPVFMLPRFVQASSGL